MKDQPNFRDTRAPLNPLARFCPGCGTQYRPEPSIAFCSACGRKLISECDGGAVQASVVTPSLTVPVVAQSAQSGIPSNKHARRLYYAGQKLNTEQEAQTKAGLLRKRDLSGAQALLAGFYSKQSTIEITRHVAAPKTALSATATSTTKPVIVAPTPVDRHLDSLEAKDSENDKVIDIFRDSTPAEQDQVTPQVLPSNTKSIQDMLYKCAPVIPPRHLLQLIDESRPFVFCYRPRWTLKRREARIYPSHLEVEGEAIRFCDITSLGWRSRRKHTAYFLTSGVRVHDEDIAKAKLTIVTSQLASPMTIKHWTEDEATDIIELNPELFQSDCDHHRRMFRKRSLSELYSFLADLTYEARVARFANHLNERGYFEYQNVRISSNGLMICGDKRARIADASWDPEDPFTLKTPRSSFLTSGITIDAEFDRDVLCALIAELKQPNQAG